MSGCLSRRLAGAVVAAALGLPIVPAPGMLSAFAAAGDKPSPGAPKTCAQAAALMNTLSGDEEEPLREIVRVCPELADAHANLGSALLRRKAYSEARASFERAIAIHEDAAFITGLGAVAAAEGDLAEAENQYQRALALDGSSSPALQGLAYLNIKKGAYADAEQLLRRAAQLTPENPVLFYNFGVVLSRQGKLDEAAASFRAALDRRPGYIEAREQLTRALLRQSRFDEAEQLLRQALDTDNSDSLAGVMLAAVLEARGQFKPAEKILVALEAKAPERVKQDPVMRLARAVLRIKRGKVKKGVAMLEELGASPQTASLPPGRLAGALGWAYLQQGDLPRAVDFLKRALKDNPKDQLAEINLEVAHTMDGTSSAGARSRSDDGPSDAGGTDGGDAESIAPEPAARIATSAAPVKPGSPAAVPASASGDRSSGESTNESSGAGGSKGVSEGIDMPGHINAGGIDVPAETDVAGGKRPAKGSARVRKKAAPQKAGEKSGSSSERRTSTGRRRSFASGK